MNKRNTIFCAVAVALVCQVPTDLAVAAEPAAAPQLSATATQQSSRIGRAGSGRGEIQWASELKCQPFVPVQVIEKVGGQRQTRPATPQEVDQQRAECAAQIPAPGLGEIGLPKLKPGSVIWAEPLLCRPFEPVRVRDQPGGEPRKANRNEVELQRFECAILASRPPPPERPAFLLAPPKPVSIGFGEPLRWAWNRNAYEVMFRWRSGEENLGSNQIAPEANHFLICVFIGPDCGSATTKEEFRLSDFATETVGNELHYEPHYGLDYTLFQGQRFHWTVAACWSQTSECSTSDRQEESWLLPPPVLGAAETGAVLERVGAANDNPYLAVTLTWEPVLGAEYYLICLYTATSPTSCGTVESTFRDATDPLIIREGGRGYTIDFETIQFRGQRVRWKVAACTSALEPGEHCSFNRSGGLYPDDRVLTHGPVIDTVSEMYFDEDELANVTFSWDLPVARDVDLIRFCILETTPYRVSQFMCDHASHGHLLDLWGQRTSCTMTEPMFSGPNPNSKRPGFSFAIGACMERHWTWKIECIWSSANGTLNLHRFESDELTNSLQCD